MEPVERPSVSPLICSGDSSFLSPRSDYFYKWTNVDRGAASGVPGTGEQGQDWGYARSGTCRGSPHPQSGAKKDGFGLASTPAAEGVPGEVRPSWSSAINGSVLQEEGSARGTSSEEDLPA